MLLAQQAVAAGHLQTSVPKDLMLYTWHLMLTRKVPLDKFQPTYWQ